VISDDEDEARYLATPRAIRERAEALFARGLDGKLGHFAIDESRLDVVAERVLAVTRRSYPDLAAIPYHSRWRHFDAGGVDRAAKLARALGEAPPDERLAAELELAITSVLLDAGAGDVWRYHDTHGGYARSEGLAVASFDLFTSGGLSSDPRAPLRADASALSGVTARTLARAFQVRDDNPLVGLEGRADVLRRLGAVVRENAAFSEPHGRERRLGALGAHLASRARGGTLPAEAVLAVVLDVFAGIWPGREVLAGKNLGDTWKHPDVGYVPFHKLSQWLTYSLFEPLERHGLRITGVDALTGLAEYRNGGLFVDGGVLRPTHPEVFAEAHPVASTVVVEWRALTVALLDRTAATLRRSLGLSTEELPLAKVLEGGTWRAGRELAAERRPSGAPPIRVVSDGTVF
jgi:hypothetical protein